MSKIKEQAQKILDTADIKIDGSRDWDIHVYNDKFYPRAIKHGSLGVGESYMDGWWDAKRLDEFFAHITSAKIDKTIVNKGTIAWEFLKAKILNLQSKEKSYEVAEKHYNLGNELYAAMLDKRMAYSAGYWKNAETLDEAQEAKLDLICKKIGLKKGMKVLDIGCGWGSFSKYAAEKYGAKVVGLTISTEQAELARKLCADLPVEIRLQDYRDVDEKFDSIVSIEMFEHVGVKNYRKYMEVVNRCLKKNGLFLLQTSGHNESTTLGEPWMQTYIFPNGVMPSSVQITTSIEGIFTLEDWHSFGKDYDKTLLAWHANFIKNWGSLKDKYDERFKRMWEYFLLSCAGTFRSKKLHTWQIVFSKDSWKGQYNSIR